MRTAVLFFRNVRRLSSVAFQGAMGPVARPARGVESRGVRGTLVQPGAILRVDALQFAGFGTFHEEHANAAVREDVVKVEEHPEEIIEKASQELFRQSNVIDDTDEVEIEGLQVKEVGREKPGADIAREVWSAKEQDGTNVFSDNSDKVHSST